MSPLGSLMRQGMLGEQEGSGLQKCPCLRALPEQRLLLLLLGQSTGQMEHRCDPLRCFLCSWIIWYSNRIVWLRGRFPPR